MWRDAKFGETHNLEKRIIYRAAEMERRQTWKRIYKPTE